MAETLKRRIEKLKHRKADIDAEYAKRVNDLKTQIRKTELELEKDHTDQNRLERAWARIDKEYENKRQDVFNEFTQERLQQPDRNSFVSGKAWELYKEIQNHVPHTRLSDLCGEFIDLSDNNWSEVKSILKDIRKYPTVTLLRLKNDYGIFKNLWHLFDNSLRHVRMFPHNLLNFSTMPDNTAILYTDVFQNI